MRSVQFNDRSITPSKVVCVGRNYTKHIQELGNEPPDSMVLFCKPNSAITHRLHYHGSHCRFEAEIVFLIEANKIAGVGLGLDLTKADIQQALKAKALPWERAKAFDNSAVMSPFVPYEGDAKGLRFELFKNGILQQAGGYDHMIYKPLEIFQEIVSFMSLQEGDLIMSGTPHGVDYYAVGDVFEGVLYEKDRILLEVAWKAEA